MVAYLAFENGTLAETLGALAVSGVRTRQRLPLRPFNHEAALANFKAAYDKPDMSSDEPLRFRVAC